MPYVNIKITNENVTKEKKVKLIEGATQLLVDVLNKNPATTSKLHIFWSNLLFKCQALNNRCNFFWVSSGIDNKIDTFFISV